MLRLDAMKVRIGSPLPCINGQHLILKEISLSFIAYLTNMMVALGVIYVKLIATLTLVELENPKKSFSFFIF